MSDYDNDELGRKRHEQAWAEFREKIRDLLNDARPERVDENDRVWREPIYGWARAHMPDETQLVRREARRVVDHMETQATKRGNDLLRDWWQGREPLDWSLVGPYPVRVDGVRVRLDHATTRDIAVAAAQLHVVNEKTYEAAEAAVAAMRDLVSRAEQAGLTVVAQLGDLPPHQKPRAAEG
jgi:hypothetical protein